MIALSDAGLPLLHELPVFKSWQGGDADQCRCSDPKCGRTISRCAGRSPIAACGICAASTGSSASTSTTAAWESPLPASSRWSRFRISAPWAWTPRTTGCPTSRRYRTCGFWVHRTRWPATTGSSRSAGRDRSNASGDGDVTTFARRGFMALAQMPALRGLSVSCLNVDDVGVSALPAFPSLKELMPMDVPDAGYRHVGRCEQLESLILMYCRDTTDAATGAHHRLAPSVLLLQQLYDDHGSNAGAVVHDGRARAHHVRRVSRAHERRRRAAGAAARAARAACLGTRDHVSGQRRVPAASQGVLRLTGGGQVLNRCVFQDLTPARVGSGLEKYNDSRPDPYTTSYSRPTIPDFS